MKKADDIICKLIGLSEVRSQAKNEIFKTLNALTSEERQQIFAELDEKIQEYDDILKNVRAGETSFKYMYYVNQRSNACSAIKPTYYDLLSDECLSEAYNIITDPSNYQANFEQFKSKLQSLSAQEIEELHRAAAQKYAISGSLHDHSTPDEAQKTLQRATSYQFVDKVLCDIEHAMQQDEKEM